MVIGRREKVPLNLAFGVKMAIWCLKVNIGF